MVQVAALSETHKWEVDELRREMHELQARLQVNSMGERRAGAEARVDEAARRNEEEKRSLQTQLESAARQVGTKKLAWRSRLAQQTLPNIGQVVHA